MAERDPEIEAMDEELVEPELPTVGERLRAAREEKGLSLEDVAAQTRIPQRHLESIENGDWDNLPAPTYTIGFAKSYARPSASTAWKSATSCARKWAASASRRHPTDVFEPADPRADHAQVAGDRRDRRGRSC